jgi:hypothetical protein
MRWGGWSHYWIGSSHSIVRETHETRIVKARRFIAFVGTAKITP